MGGVWFGCDKPGPYRGVRPFLATFLVIHHAPVRQTGWRATMDPLRKFLVNQDGVTSVEYAVLLALIITVCITAISLVGGSTGNFWSNNRDELNNAFGSI
jgi:Flp pilus assembly pilin Flp